MRWRRSALLFIFVLATILLFFAFYTYPINKNVRLYIDNEGIVNYEAAVHYWKDEIENMGGSNAFEKLVIDLSGTHPPQAHFIAHAFGEALYSTEGIHGFSSCKKNFAYGCYHQFIAMAIAEYGIDIVHTINETCLNSADTSYGSCTHGIGHGVLAFSGYQYENLIETLSVCRLLDTPKKSRCAIGAFMEYNQRTLAAVDTSRDATARALTQESKYEPCESVPSYFKKECAEELPNWWISTLNPGMMHDGPYKQAGTFCEHFSSDEELQGCFYGIGVVIARTYSTPSKISTLCQNVSQDTARQHACLIGAVRYSKLGEEQSITETTCSIFNSSKEWLGYCTTHARDSTHEIPFPQY